MVLPLRWAAADVISRRHPCLLKDCSRFIGSSSSEQRDRRDFLTGTVGSGCDRGDLGTKIVGSEGLLLVGWPCDRLLSLIEESPVPRRRANHPLADFLYCDADTRLSRERERETMQRPGRGGSKIVKA